MPKCRQARPSMHVLQGVAMKHKEAGNHWRDRMGGRRHGNWGHQSRGHARAKASAGAGPKLWPKAQAVAEGMS